MLSSSLYASDIVFRTCSTTDGNLSFKIIRIVDNPNSVASDRIEILKDGVKYKFPNAKVSRTNDDKYIARFKYFEKTATNLILNTRNYTSYLEGFYSLPPKFQKRYLLPRSVFCK